MSGSLTSTSTLLTAAEKAAQANNVTASTSAATVDAGTTASSALSSIAGNFNSFLTMLTTQLQNQDPSTPMSSDTFTSELATFAGVQQQVNTNTNLSTLISLNQDSQVTADTSLVGETASFTGAQIPLQSSKGSVGFTTTSAEPIAIAVTNASGNVVRTVQETSAVGSNSWAWDGKDDSGNTVADGTYGVAVETQDTSGNTSTIPFSATGTITGISKSPTGVSLQMGATSVDMTDVTSIVAATPGATPAATPAAPAS